MNVLWFSFIFQPFSIDVHWISIHLSFNYSFIFLIHHSNFKFECSFEFQNLNLSNILMKSTYFFISFLLIFWIIHQRFIQLDHSPLKFWFWVTIHISKPKCESHFKDNQSFFDSFSWIFQPFSIDVHWIFIHLSFNYSFTLLIHHSNFKFECSFQFQSLNLNNILMKFLIFSLVF